MSLFELHSFVYCRTAWVGGFLSAKPALLDAQTRPSDSLYRHRGRLFGFMKAVRQSRPGYRNRLSRSDVDLVYWKDLVSTSLWSASDTMCKQNRV